MIYKDRNRTVVKEGDFLFYSEQPVTKLADSVFEVVIRNDEYLAKCICANIENEYKLVTYDYVEKLSDFLNTRKILNEFEKITVNETFNPVKFMNKRSPLSENE